MLYNLYYCIVYITPCYVMLCIYITIRPMLYYNAVLFYYIMVYYIVLYYTIS